MIQEGSTGGSRCHRIAAFIEFSDTLEGATVIHAARSGWLGDRATEALSETMDSAVLASPDRFAAGAFLRELSRRTE